MNVAVDRLTVMVIRRFRTTGHQLLVSRIWEALCIADVLPALKHEDLHTSKFKTHNYALSLS